jgi:ferredoxin-NADP reductase
LIEELENCGYEKLVTLAHGDAKPNNFMFRKEIEQLQVVAYIYENSR